MQKALGYFLTAIISLLLLAYSYRYWQNRQMNRLYAEATELQVSSGNANATESLRKLATYHNARSNKLILQIAIDGMRSGAILGSDEQTEAIKILGKSNDPEIASSMASLLQPHNGLNVRQATAQTLLNLPCERRCVESILHYLERIMQGELNLEDSPVPSAGFDVSFKNEHEQLYGNLYSVLRREHTETIATLQSVYGLGSFNPASFALDLLPRLKLTESCPLLLKSNQRIRSRSPEFFRAPRQQLQTAINSLDCQ